MTELLMISYFLYTLIGNNYTYGILREILFNWYSRQSYRGETRRPQSIDVNILLIQLLPKVTQLLVT